MLREKDGTGVAPGLLKGARSATGGDPGAAAIVGRWSTNRKRKIVLRLLRGESDDAVSREVSVPIYKLEQWRDRALAGIDSGLKERENDPLEKQFGEANRVTGGYVWTIVPLEKRTVYMQALEQASSFRDIRPLSKFFAQLVREQTEIPAARPAK